jgi:hypothetical protein
MAKKKMKMRPAKKTKKKAKPIRPLAIPKDLRGLVIRKFKSKDKTKRYVVIRLPHDGGYRVSALHRGVQTVVRGFEVPTTTDIPKPVWLSVQRQMSGWFAGHVARKNADPSVKQERSRRRRYIKKALANYNAHLVVKDAVRVAHGHVKPTQPKGPLPMVVPYICIYDPRAHGVRTTFTIHEATCGRLDQERNRSVLKHNGDSWIVEAHSPEEAITLQLKEFDEDDMGYDRSDFSLHINGCCRVEKKVLGKTVLGRVSSKVQRGKR